MSSFPCLVRFMSGSGHLRYRLGEPLADRYVRCLGRTFLSDGWLPGWRSGADGWWASPGAAGELAMVYRARHPPVRRRGGEPRLLPGAGPDCS